MKILFFTLADIIKILSEQWRTYEADKKILVMSASCADRGTGGLK